MLIISFLVNVGVALMMGVAIGVERQIHQHPAGLRTNRLGLRRCGPLRFPDQADG